MFLFLTKVLSFKLYSKARDEYIKKEGKYFGYGEFNKAVEFSLEPKGSGFYFKLENNKVLDIEGSRTNVIAYGKHGGPNQIFKKEMVDSQLFRIIYTRGSIKKCFTAKNDILQVGQCTRDDNTLFAEHTEDIKAPIEKPTPVVRPKPVVRPETKIMPRMSNRSIEPIKQQEMQHAPKIIDHIENPETKPIHRVIDQKTNNYKMEGRNYNERNSQQLNAYNKGYLDGLNASKNKTSEKCEKNEKAIENLCKTKEKEDKGLFKGGYVKRLVRRYTN